jgi:ATP-dependent helicase Lhr and Lhr-like helicase
MEPHQVLSRFHPAVRDWFVEAFGAPSPPQILGWPSISSGQHTLILAPTGSGKTLAAFLWAINHLVEQHLTEELPPGVRVLYVSPLKALNNDIQRNLEAPLHGIRSRARTLGLSLPLITTAVRTGDTPQSKRAAMLRHPPDILITTPESLYLMLTSKQARKMFSTVQYVIVDEIHSICSNKRGVHLSLTLERLAAIADQEFVRIGLSATQKPLELIARFLGGQEWRGKKLVPRHVELVDAGQKKEMDLRVECAVPDFSLLPQEGVWPLVFEELLDLIKAHKTTLVFVNNRRLAERVAATLNAMVEGKQDTFNMYAVPATLDGAATRPVHSPDRDLDGELFQAYHGSMSRTAREQMENDLKAGRLRALIATSSLELGIDIGSIDLVVQLQSPKSVARGLQRVGRSGHLINATSKGRIFPTYREDLVESAIVARSMRNHEVEPTTVPMDCLDVLAQQIVAMVSVDDWETEKLFDLIRQSYCYNSLSGKLFRNVLQMLAGRYSHEAFRELRARVSWDKVNDTLSALPGSNQLAITSGGTISDRGYYGVYLEDGKTKVGEVDEEFVYESRSGDTFILGSSVWRIAEITPNTLSVIPAPGQPGRMPFWRGEGIGRSYELAGDLGGFRREMNERLDDPGCLTWLQREFPVDSRAAWNIMEYLKKQREATGAIPNDRLMLIEGFRDEIGDPRIVIHAPFGRRINGLLCLVAAHRILQMLQTTPQVMYNDDGILLRCSDVTDIPLSFLDGVTTQEAEEIVLTDVLASPLFGGQFRQNAARALLMPKLAPGKRTPLWLQRLRAGDLLQIARNFDDFPIVIETMRDVLNDVLDFPRFREIINGIESGSIELRSITTEIPSPFAASMLFDFVAVYMYEWDQPREERQSQYLSINRELLSEVIDTETISSLIKPEAVSTVERQIQHRAEGYRARTPEELLEILLRVGDLTDEEIASSVTDDSGKMLDALAGNGRVVRLEIGKEKRWIAGEYRELYESLHSAGVLGTILLRYLQSHGPTSTEELVQRYALSSDAIDAVLERLARTEPILRGQFTNAASTLQWCYRPNLERIHRQSIGILRKEITPSTLPQFTDFLFHWQGLHREEEGVHALQPVLEQLSGIPLPAEIWERDVLRARMRGLTRDVLDRAGGAGGIVWSGNGPGKLRCLPRGEAAIYADPQGTVELGSAAKHILAHIGKHGASFFSDIRNGTGLSLDALNTGIADLFWNGYITNDLFSELQNLRRPTSTSQERPIERLEILDPRHNPARGRLMQTARRALRQVPGWSGRWSLLHSPENRGEELPMEERAQLQAVQMLNRYGIVAREFYQREALLPWPLLASAMHRMEMRGEIRRGYFVEGLSGMQFALPLAVEESRRLRSQQTKEDNLVLLNACDPASPYGPGVPLTLPAVVGEEHRFARIASHYLIFRNGTPILLLESYGSRLWTISPSEDEILTKALRIFAAVLDLPAHLRPVKSITVEHCDGIRPAQSPFEPILRSLGFTRDRNQTMVKENYL